MNQFVQKLFPFADWIKGGNVLQQAQESGINFNLDVTQAGQNLDQTQFYFDIEAVDMFPPEQQQSARFTTVFADKPGFIQRVAFFDEGVTLLSPISGSIRFYVRYQAQYASVWGSNNRIAATLVIGDLDFDIPAYTGSVFPFVSKLSMPIMQNYLPTASFGFEIFLSRALAVGEAIEGTYGMYGYTNMNAGMKVLQP